VVHRCILPVAAFLFFASSMVPQTPGRGFPTPPPSLDQEKQAPGQHPSTGARHSDLEQAQREADELARIAQTVPADITKVREGMLPKDAIEKLKQIEKLSKRLRSELTQ
jgi:hypothetical protein